MELIRREQLEAALSQGYRQYLTGHLTHPQELEHIPNDIEIGISNYDKFTADVPHVHPVATEQAFVLRGYVRIRCFEKGGVEETEAKTGDFFLIRPGVRHATKNAAKTCVLFIKSPGINDKTPFEADPDTLTWLSSWD